MAEIINLRLAKKRKAKDVKDKAAEQNRILFGRTKAEKQFERNAKRKTARFLDDNRLERNKLQEPTDPDTDGK